MEPKTEPKPRLKDRLGDQLKAQLKTVARITGLMLCCAVLFVSGFYLGLYQGNLTGAPEGGTITGTYSPSTVPANGPPVDGAPLSTLGSGGEALPATSTSPESEATAHGPVATPPTPEELLAGLMWPVNGKISGEPEWVFSKDLDQWNYYPGVEIACDSGTPVVAALAGIVDGLETDPVLGTVLRIRHESRVVTTYGRVLGLDVGPGDAVSQGDAIGRSGAGGVYFSISCEDEPLSTRQCLATAK